MEKNRILFIVSPIKSHFIPSFYLAKLLSDAADIYYTVNFDPLEELVLAQGFKTIKINSDRFGIGTEKSKINSKGNKISSRTKLKNFLRNKLYVERKNELFEIVENLSPYAIIIDTFSSTDFAVLYPFKSKLKFLFFNPMLSTYEVPGFPLINEEKWLETRNYNKNSLTKIWKNKISKVGINAWIQFQRVYWKNGIRKQNKLLLDNPFVYSFKNIPEILLAPLELEFTEKIKKDDQYYLGLCVTPSRTDLDLDEDFITQFPDIIEKKISAKKKILYCSFGTYFNEFGDLKTITSFILALVEALREQSDILVIVAVNEEIKTVLYEITEVPDHFYIFKKIKQLEVLQYADGFITHGGLGSLKEAIYYKVPVLVYPLDKNWDQNGNALKAEYHGIGLQGDIEYEEPEMILQKVKEILEKRKFKNRIDTLNREITTKNTSNYEIQLLEELLKIDLISHEGKGNRQKSITEPLKPEFIQ